MKILLLFLSSKRKKQNQKKFFQNTIDKAKKLWYNDYRKDKEDETMTREFKMVIKQVGTNFCYVSCESRDDNSDWNAQGVIPMFGTVEEVKAQQIANQMEYGWTLYDMEEKNTLVFWKELD